jgi:hypothetical protein
MIMMIVSVATGNRFATKKLEKFLPSMDISLFLIMIIISQVTLSSFRKTGLLPKFDVVEGSVIFRLSPVRQELLELENAFEGIVFKGWGGITSGTI